MSGIRSIVRNPTIKGYAAATSVPIYVDSDDNIMKMIPAGSGTTEVQVIDASSAQTMTNKTLTSPTLTTPTLASSSSVPYVADATGAGSYKIARGSGTLVTGAQTVATGLTTVTSFQATLLATAFATGAAQMLSIDSITTGAVVVKGYFNLNATGATAAATGTGAFHWFAVGT